MHVFLFFSDDIWINLGQQHISHENAYISKNLHQTHPYNPSRVTVFTGIMINDRMPLHVLLYSSMQNNQNINENLQYHVYILLRTLFNVFQFIDYNVLLHIK